MKIIEITDADFDATINSDTPILVDFWAPWCGPCKILAPLLESVDYPDVTVAKVNIDENMQAAQKYGVRSIPTLLMFKNGELLDSQFTTRTKDQLTSFIDKNT